MNMEQYSTIYFIADENDGELYEWHTSRGDAEDTLSEDYGDECEIVVYRRVLN